VRALHLSLFVRLHVLQKLSRQRGSCVLVHLNIVFDEAGAEMRDIVTDSGVVESRYGYF
jgi:hypothetical protein